MANPEWTEPGDWGGEIDDTDKDAAICKNCGGEGCFFCDGEGHHTRGVGHRARHPEILAEIDRLNQQVLDYE